MPPPLGKLPAAPPPEPRRAGRPHHPMHAHPLARLARHHRTLRTAGGVQQSMIAFRDRVDNRGVLHSLADSVDFLLCNDDACAWRPMDFASVGWKA